jgi:hypothetical protein
MSTGGGTTTQTTAQNTDPWKPAQPYLTDLMSQAQGLYSSSSQNTGYAPFNTVVDPSSTTLQGLNATAQRAMNGSPLTAQAGSSLMDLMQPQNAPGTDALQSLMGGYVNPGSAYTQAATNANPAMAGASQMASNGVSGPGDSVVANAAGGGMQNAATGLAGRMATQNPNANPANAYLGSMASSGSLNPYLDSLFNASSKPVIDQINAQFGAGGRTGSAANQQLLTQNLGDMSAQIHANGWQNAINNQLAATGQIQGAFDNAQGRNLQGASLLGNLSGQNLDRQLGAANQQNSDALSRFGAQQGALGLLGNLGQQQASNNLAAGSQLSADAAAQASTRGNAANNLNSQFNTGQNMRFGAAQAAPGLANNDYTDLQNLMNVGGAYDSQSAAGIQDALTRWQYQQQQPWNLLDNYSGLLTGYAGLGGQSNGTQNVKQPGQSLIPSLIGAGVSAASMMSDRRLKTDITRIGTYENGLPKYRFRFIKGEKKYHVGPMAQDVLVFRPHAVRVMPTGYYGVDYAQALAA